MYQSTFGEIEYQSASRDIEHQSTSRDIEYHRDNELEKRLKENTGVYYSSLDLSSKFTNG